MSSFLLLRTGWSKLPVKGSLLFSCCLMLLIPSIGFAQALDEAFGIGGYYKYYNYTYANDMHLDAQGNMYLAGTLEETNTSNKFDFDPGPGTYYLETLESTGCVEDAYLAKYDQALNLLWGFVVGGSTCDSAESMALDAQSNVYISGRFGNTADFDPGPGELLLDGFAFQDGYLAKYSPDGEVLWVFKIEGADRGASDIEIDKQGNIFIGGEFNDPVDLDPSEEVFLLEPRGTQDIFLAKYDKYGAFLWGAGFGGDDTDRFTGIELDDDGNVTLAGSFRGIMDMDPGPREDVFDAGERDDIFLAQFSKNGRYHWGFHLGEDDLIVLRDLKIADDNEIYIAGSLESETGVDFDPGTNAYPVVTGDNRNAYFARYDAAGALKMVTHFGGEGSLGASQVAVTPGGSIIVGGGFSGSAAADLDPGPAEYKLNDTEFHDSFLAKYTKAGHLDWAFGIGYATYGMELDALELNEAGSIYLAGNFGEAFSNALDFDPTESEYIVDYTGGNQDIFVARYTDPDPIYRVNAGGQLVYDAVLDWVPDTKNAPVPYVNATGANNKTAAVTGNISNPTSADLALFSSLRWDPREREEVPMQWTFPVESGDYKVCLLFVEDNEAYGGVGARVFDVQVEETIYWDNLDVYAATGLHTGLRHCFFAQVTDDALTLTLVPELTRGRPMISGVEITPATATVHATTSSNKMSAEPGRPVFVPADTEIPRTTLLDKNYPNPFNPSTTIRFSLAEKAQVQLVVYDMLGRAVERLIDGGLAAGLHEVSFNAGNLPSGTYLYKLETPHRTFTQTMVLLK